MDDPIWSQITEADRAFLISVARGLLIARTKYPGPQDRYIALTGEAGEAFYAFQRLIVVPWRTSAKNCAKSPKWPAAWQPRETPC